MKARRLEVFKSTTHQPYPAAPGTTVVTLSDVRALLLSGRILRHVLRYEQVRLHVDRTELLPRPFATAALLRLLSRGRCEIVDSLGNTQSIGSVRLLLLFRDLVQDAVDIRRLKSGATRQAAALAGASFLPVRGLDLTGRPVYVRSELVFGLEAGGSVGHAAGVLNNLGDLGGKPILVTSDAIPTVSGEVDVVIVHTDRRFRDFVDMPPIAYNTVLTRSILRAVEGQNSSLVYQRYSAYNYSGISAAQALGVPFVLEYNGSEVWINRNWGRPLKYEKLAERIELLNLGAADLVVVVSEVMRDELVQRGIDEQKILVNSNGVDPDLYSPDVDGRPVRRRLGVEDDFVIGFIGTFGRWHGAENLASAFNALLAKRPELRDRVRLLMIGDGVGLPATRAIIESGGHADRVIFTGRVPQAEGPSYLAACDTLVSPHVPNPDGTRFFGSPTKLFEYMAMGKPIVASSLDQIADVLEDGRTAVMVESGNVGSLVGGIERVIDDPGSAGRLAAAAREEAVRNHTWREHTRRIVEALSQRCA